MPSIDPKPVAIDFSRYFSVETVGRKRSALKELKPYFDIPGMISDMFPLAPYSEPVKTEPLRPDLATELQYSATYGTPHLLSWLKEHIQRVHSPKYDDWNVLCTAGNTDGVDGVLRAFFNRGDHVLMEEFGKFHSGRGLRPVGVPLDSDGVDANALDRIMQEWDEEKRGGPRPKMIIIVPAAKAGDLLGLPQVGPADRRGRPLPNGAASPIVPTFLSIDTDGRVIRIDSFSKIVAPGSRLGYITGHKVLVEKIMNTRESATRCLAMIDLLKKHVPAECIEIPAPAGGMFLWVRLRVENHPLVKSEEPEAISKRAFKSMIDEKVLMVPSEAFKCPSDMVWSREDEARRIFVRISFSLPPMDEMEEGAKRMGRALAKEWQL
ncbi:hypothetical protein IAU60_004917 [Kwoniella sp. DSM 27419]